MARPCWAGGTTVPPATRLVTEPRAGMLEPPNVADLAVAVFVRLADLTAGVTSTVRVNETVSPTGIPAGRVLVHVTVWPGDEQVKPSVEADETNVRPVGRGIGHHDGAGSFDGP